MDEGAADGVAVDLWKTGHGRRADGRCAVWLAFVLGICLSLCANIAAVPEFSVFAVAVAACRPLALLLAVERGGGIPGIFRPLGPRSATEPTGHGPAGRMSLCHLASVGQGVRRHSWLNS